MKVLTNVCSCLVYTKEEETKASSMLPQQLQAYFFILEGLPAARLRT